MEVLEIEKQLKEKGEYYQQKRHTIGSIIKHHRREQMMTLEETAEGICSVSYLSKLENNLIKPSDKFLNSLKEKFNIQESELVVQSDDYVETLFNMLISKQTIEDHMIKAVKYKTDYQSKMTHLAYQVKLKKYQEAYRIYRNLVSYLVVFSEEEIELFLFIMTLYFYEQEQYSEVIELQHKLAPDSNTIMTLYIKKYYCLALYEQGHIKLAHQMGNQVIQLMLKFQALDDILELQFKEKEANSILGIQEQKETQKYHMKHYNSDHDYYFKAHIYYHRQHFEKALFYANQVKEMDQIKVLKLMILDKLEYIEEIKQMIDMQDVGSQSYLMLKTFLQHKYFKQDKLVDYVRKEILQSNVFTEQYLILEYLFSEAERIFKANNFYKETAIILKKHNNVLKRLIKGI